MRPARVAILAGLVTALLAGCASFHPAPLSAAQIAGAIDARSLDDARLATFIAAELGKSEPASRWDLARLTLAALYYHPDLDIARARLAAARAAVVTAGQRPNPTLDLTAAFGTSAAAGAIPMGAAPLTIGPVVTFVIETFGKREYRTAEARQLAEAARQDVATAAWQVRGHVRGALIDLWMARGRLSLLRRRLALEDELVDLLERRQAAGATSALDVTRERVLRAQFALAVRNAEQARVDARARLATSIGIPLAALDGVTLSFDALDRPAAPPAGIAAGALRRRALTGRSDVAAALAAYAAAQSALQLAIAGQYPNLTLGPGYQYDFGLDKYMLGPSLVLPIFNHNEGPIAEAMARRRQMAARFTALEAAIIGAIDRAAADYRAASAVVATADALTADARRRERQMRRSFAAGEIDRPSFVAAEIEEAAAALSRFDAVAKQRRALGRIEDALRQPLFEPAAPFLVPETSPRPPAEPPA
ncbi:MAG TPA: TolC family protein [Stellaceae bacterium]|nr:TolC family protein [Stellaceae bacterium]